MEIKILMYFFDYTKLLIQLKNAFKNICYFGEEIEFNYIFNLVFLGKRIYIFSKH